VKPPINRFTVDLSQVADQREELETRMKELGGQISRIIEKMQIDDNPVLVPILHLTKKRSALEKLARALNRVAPLVDEYDRLHKRMTVLEVASEDPGWLAACLGDFSTDFQSLFDKRASDWMVAEEKDEE
jgi:hypothetical protein